MFRISIRRENIYLPKNIYTSLVRWVQSSTHQNRQKVFFYSHIKGVKFTPPELKCSTFICPNALIFKRKRFSRYTITDTKIENGMKSQITISRADREDSGIYKCHAENAFGRNEHVINLTVQERPDPPSMLEIVEVSSRSVKLSWRRSFDGNSPFKGYLIQYKTLTGNQDDWSQPSTINQNLSVDEIQTR